MNKPTILGLVVLFTCGVGCATVAAPADLVNARNADARARAGVAAQLDPADLHSAREVLAQAERAFNEEGDTQETRDLAYTALRRIETAESRARAVEATRSRDQSLADLRAAEAAAVTTTAAALGRARGELALQGRELETERVRREAADRRAQRAASELARIAAVRQEARGTVLTLSGSVLFVSGKADLLPTARVKLNQVAEALGEPDDDSRLLVEGHTDSRGSAALNQDLSQRRAEAVRDYLKGRGIAADRLTAQGLGPSRPVADNASPEGRADNRRVEIVIQPAP